MKRVVALVLFALSTGVYAQLYVSPTTTDGSYVYVNDTYIFVENDVNLVTNSTATNTTTNRFPSIVLRNQGQLLQGNGSSSDNDGSGDLSVYQEGSADAFAFNFWGSPVGLAQESSSTLAIGNTDFAFRGTGQNIFQPVSEGISNPALIIPPNAGLNGSTSNGGSLNIASFWLFKFTGGSSTAEFIPVQNTGSVATGLGFTMKGINGSDNTTTNDGIANNIGSRQRYDFRGRPHNGTINVDIADDDSVLMGNPYPSALDLSYFLLENSISGTQVFTDPGDPTNQLTVNGTQVLTGTAFYWDSDRSVQSHFLEEYEGGYGTFVPMNPFSSGIYSPPLFFTFDENGNNNTATGGSGNPIERRFMPIGQGFFVVSEASPEANQVVFRNDHRVFNKEGNNSTFRSNGNTVQPSPVVGIKSFYRDANDMAIVPQIRILAHIDDTYNRELIVALDENASFDIDAGMDGKTIDNVSTDVTFNIDDEEKFVINSIPTTEEALLPLKLEVANQTFFTFYVKSLINIDQDEIYLFDKLRNIYYDIVNNKATFILNAGVHNNRFFIVFQKFDKSNDSDKDVLTENIIDNNRNEEITVFKAISVRQNNTTNQLEIVNPERAELSSMDLFDITGKRVLSSSQMGSDSSYTFPTRNLSTGVYIVRIQTENGLTKSRKVSISN